MVVDKEYLRQLRKNCLYTGTEFTDELGGILLDRLGTEPSPHEYSEQDLHEQARKIVMQYQSPEGRLRLLCGMDKMRNGMACLERKIARRLYGEANQDASFGSEECSGDSL